jgi:hypothetical protein
MGNVLKTDNVLKGGNVLKILLSLEEWQYFKSEYLIPGISYSALQIFLKIP